ncbi:MAG TPA: secretion system protein, partial [Erythrobacter sp.]|nr:secretion system protein [Erythrobacter sp.]
MTNKITNRGNDMKRRLTAKVLLASLAIAPLASVPMTTVTAQSVVEPTKEVVLSIGRGEL